MFDRMLISLGLAEAPPAPEYKGNPDTQVWVDLHTALYYCPEPICTARRRREKSLRNGMRNWTNSSPPTANLRLKGLLSGYL